jgi:biopolymer transport protein ExbB/TolQ
MSAINVKKTKFFLRAFFIMFLIVSSFEWFLWAISPADSLTKRLQPTYSYSRFWIFSNDEAKIDYKYLKEKKEYEEKKFNLFNQKQDDIKRFEDYLINTKSKSITELKLAIQEAKLSPATEYVNKLFIPILKSRIKTRSQS